MKTLVLTGYEVLLLTKTRSNLYLNNLLLLLKILPFNYYIQPVDDMVVM